MKMNKKEDNKALRILNKWYKNVFEDGKPLSQKEEEFIQAYFIKIKKEN